MLVQYFPPRIIETRRDYQASLNVIEQLMGLKTLTKDQASYIELLSDLVESYEMRHFSIGEPTLSELLAHLIESCGESKAAVAREAGVSASLICDVLAGRRSLSLAAIRRLAAYFGVDASLFVEAGSGQSVN
jgi:HTH-type transcriptional regulator/antitoxin HigA